MKTISPLKAIRFYCIECSGDSPKEVKLCPISDCPFYQFRLGNNPNRSGIGGNIGSHNELKNSAVESSDFCKNQKPQEELSE